MNNKHFPSQFFIFIVVFPNLGAHQSSLDSVMEEVAFLAPAQMKPSGILIMESNSSDSGDVEHNL